MVPLCSSPMPRSSRAARASAAAEADPGNRGGHRRRDRGAPPRAARRGDRRDRPQPADARRRAARRVVRPKSRFSQADALDLPFEDGSFDLVVCQFGVMFFPDKVKGNAEARRVLRDGGRYLLAIWDGIDRNLADARSPTAQCASTFSRRSAAVHGARAVRLSRPGRIERDLRAAGFADGRDRDRRADAAAAGSADDAALRPVLRHRRWVSSSKSASPERSTARSMRVDAGAAAVRRRRTASRRRCRRTS